MCQFPDAPSFNRVPHVAYGQYTQGVGFSFLKCQINPVSERVIFKVFTCFIKINPASAIVAAGVGI